jgi:hypothetical protein
LKADRAALDTRVTLKNPGDKAVNYEYWTCTTLGAGSDPASPKATAGAEIVAPISAYTTASVVASDCFEGRRARFRKIQVRETCALQELADDGHRYAAPDMGGANFWGVDQSRQRGRHLPHRR